MAISFNTSASNSVSGATEASALTLVVPAGVLPGDLMLLVVNVFTWDVNTGVDFGATSPAGPWVSMGAGLYDSGDPSSTGLHTVSRCFKRVATASDPGSTITFQITGTPSNNQYWTSAGLVAYTGAAGGVDVFAADANVTGNHFVTCPTGKTGADGEWAVYLGAISVNGSGAIGSVPSGTTQRVNQFNAGVDIGIADSNGSVGLSGTSIGGGTFTTNNSIWYGIFTVALSPSAGPPYRLMDGVSGRPGIGSTNTQPPTANTDNNTLTFGTEFKVTQPGLALAGFWFWRTDTNQPSTAQFALWQMTGLHTGTYQGASTHVTATGMTAGAWNYVPLSSPFPLTANVPYMAVCGNSGFHPLTVGQFGSTGVYPAGITNGPLVAYSSAGGSNPDPYGNVQSPYNNTGSDPTTLLPINDNSQMTVWVDVAVVSAGSPPPSGNLLLASY